MNAAKPILFVAVAMIVLGCNQRPPAGPQSALPFEYTNVIHEPSAFRAQPSTETIINFTNLVWFGHETDRITMGLGPADYDVAVFFDRTNRTVRRVVQSRKIGTNNVMIIDSDGDGIPETRNNISTREMDILLSSEWTPTRGSGPSREALINSNWTKVRLANGRWRPASAQ